MTTAVPTPNVGKYETQVEASLANVSDTAIVTLIWMRDHTVWKPEPKEITNRLGWLDIANTMSSEISTLKYFASDIHCGAGFHHVVLLGMGGSSLGAAFLVRTFTNSDS
jgi:transaldolase/glucose-6-phosphate isomerase